MLSVLYALPPVFICFLLHFMEPLAKRHQINTHTLAVVVLWHLLVSLSGTEATYQQCTHVQTSTRWSTLEILFSLFKKGVHTMPRNNRPMQMMWKAFELLVPVVLSIAAVATYESLRPGGPGLVPDPPGPLQPGTWRGVLWKLLFQHKIVHFQCLKCAF